MSRLIYIIMVCVVVAGLVSCDDYDDFTDGPDTAVWFSTDTVSFDTLFVNSPSITKTLIAWNAASAGIRISDVRLERGTQSPFRVNVDGEFLYGSLGDLEIRHGDSLFVFAEVTLDRQWLDDDMTTVCDRLIFTLENGRQQSVVLKATVIDAEVYRDGLVVMSDTTFTSDRRRVIHGGLIVAEGATLRLERGTTLYFHTGASLHVYGTLLACGTLDSVVTLRGDRLDNLFAYLPYDNTVGRWGGLHIHSTSRASRLDYADIHSGDYGVRVDTSEVVIDGCIVHNVGGDGLRLLASRAEVANSQFSNTRGYCVGVLGGDSRFTFCTMAQFYPWDVMRGAALFLSDQLLGNEIETTAMRFSSCLVTGYSDDELMGDMSNADTAPYLFNRCVLRTPEVSDDGHYVGVTWELARNDGKFIEGLPMQGGTQFKFIDTHRFLYDFRPLATSIAVFAADAADALDFPTDRYGVARTDSIAAGCYQSVE